LAIVPLKKPRTPSARNVAARQLKGPWGEGREREREREKERERES